MSTLQVQLAPSLQGWQPDWRFAPLKSKKHRKLFFWFGRRPIDQAYDALEESQLCCFSSGALYQAIRTRRPANGGFGEKAGMFGVGTPERTCQCFKNKSSRSGEVAGKSIDDNNPAPPRTAILRLSFANGMSGATCPMAFSAALRMQDWTVFGAAVRQSSGISLAAGLLELGQPIHHLSSVKVPRVSI